METMIDQNYLPTVAELLELPIFQDARILCGEGTEHPVSGIFLSEIPDYYDWVRSGELVVTNCYALYDSPNLLLDFIPRLSGLGVAGACVKPDRFLGGIVPKQMISAALELGFPLVELPTGLRFSDITKAVSDELLRRQTEVLRDSLAVGELLTRTITQGATLEEIANTVREITGRSTFILDGINHRQAVSVNACDTQSWPKPGSGTFFEEVVQKAERYEMEAAGNTFGTLFLFGEKCKPELRNELLGQILLSIPLEISRFQLVHQDEDRAFREFFVHLLSDQILDDAAEGTRAEELDFCLSGWHILLSLRMREAEKGNLHAMLFHRTVFHQALREIIGNAAESIHYMENGSDTQVLLSSPDGNSNFQELTSQLCGRLNSYLNEHTELSVSVGCSRPHAGISGLISCNKEAGLALRAASSRQGSKALRFDDLGILSLLYAADPDKEVSAFVKDVLKELVEPSFAKGPELLDTLDSYFRHLGNQRKMAEELFIHYNTVAFRLKQVQEITGKQLNKSEDRMSLELALYLYGFFNA